MLGCKLIIRSLPLSSVPGFAAVDVTVMVMTELMWALILHDHTLLRTGFKELWFLNILMSRKKLGADDSKASGTSSTLIVWTAEP